MGSEIMAGKRVLIIDDDKSILRLLTLILQRKGYSTDATETGREALEKLSHDTYDVALIDAVLPDMSGLDLLRSIPSQTKKVVITGVVSVENQRRARADGAYAYLLKPVRPGNLLQIIAD
jgi:DNA-binding NtrC family response regulator